MGITCFTAPTQCFQVLYMCMFQRCCARFRDVVHVSEMLCTFLSSCARFTSPLMTFVFNCIHTERILISKSIGATKHVLIVLLIYVYYIYIRMHIYIYFQMVCQKLCQKVFQGGDHSKTVIDGFVMSCATNGS